MGKASPHPHATIVVDTTIGKRFFEFADARALRHQLDAGRDANVADDYSISRAELDAFALANPAEAAREVGRHV